MVGFSLEGCTMVVSPCPKSEIAVSSTNVVHAKIRSLLWLLRVTV